MKDHMIPLEMQTTLISTDKCFPVGNFGMLDSCLSRTPLSFAILAVLPGTCMDLVMYWAINDALQCVQHDGNI